MRYQWAVASHQGRLRTNNEDSAYPGTSGSGFAPFVAMVADGMGGHVAGETASRIAVDTAVSVDGPVQARIRAGNTAILEEVSRRPELAGMGTTLTLVEIGKDAVARFGHVGDSRAYLLRKGGMRQLTEDHTIVAEYVRAGKLTPEEASDHPQRNMITRALGLVPEVEVDTFILGLRVHDRILLCSDGVNSMLGDAAIAAALDDSTPEEAVWALVEAANKAGGHDNITAVVVDVEPDPDR